MKKLLLVVICVMYFIQGAWASSAPIVCKLKHGQTLVMQQVPESKLVCIDTWIKTGSINEDDTNSGVAHFLEHLFFKGSKNHPQGEFERILDSKGATYNAATSKDFTHYYITIKKEDLPLAIELQSDMLLNPCLAPEDVARERKVVLEEIARSKDNPSSCVFKNLNSILFSQHPYKREVLGNDDIIRNISQDEIYDFFTKWYGPDNMVTVITGNFDPCTVKKLVEKNFAQKSRKNYVTNYSKEPSLKQITTKIERGNYNTTYVEMGFKGDEFNNIKQSYSLDVLAVILGQGTTSRLYKSLKEDKNLVNYVDAGHYNLKDDSIFYITLGLDGKNYSKAQNEVMEQIKCLQKKGITKEELVRAQNILERSHIYSNESIENIANAIGYNMVLGNNIKYYTDYIPQIKNLTVKDVNDVAQQFLDVNKMAVSVLAPKNEKLGNVDIAPLKNEHLAYNAVGKLVFNYKLREKCPEAKKLNISGSDIIFERNSANDVISVEIFVKGGDWVFNKVGLGDILARTLTRGTNNASAQDISKQLEDNGIILDAVSSPDYLQISLKSTKGDFDKAFCILKDIMNNANFPQKEIDKAKQELLASLKQQQDLPQMVGFNALKHKLYPNSPYGTSLATLEKNIPTVTQNEVVNYYNKYFTPSNLIISVCGNIEEKKVEELFSNWIERTGNSVDLASLQKPFKPLEKSTKILINKPSKTAWAFYATRTPSIKDNKDFATLKVINSILSGGMSSRLFVELREKRGLAYEVGASYPTLLNNSYFVCYIGTNPNNTEFVLKEFKNQIDKLCNQKVDEQELDYAKQRLIGYLAQAQETNEQKASIKGRYEALNKPYNFVKEYEEMIETVTADDIMNVSNKYLKQPSVTILVKP